MKSHFKFNKQERSGIFFLLFIIIVLQGSYFVVKSRSFQGDSSLSVNTLMEARLDSLKLQLIDDSPKIFPFNPNYLTDYKGYALGLTKVEIDRLLAFRAQNNYVNSTEEFQKVTQISDSLLEKLIPYFKFPQWKKTARPNQKQFSSTKTNAVAIRDLNKVSAEDLMQISGIGEVLSQRIIKFRDRLGGFLVNEQLYDVYGLAPEVVDRALKRFKVIEVPAVNKININSATANEISQLVYINRKLAEEIVTVRGEKGNFESYKDLFNIKGFPINKIERIKLYLFLQKNAEE
ncbi:MULTISPECIES: helix-hairpin-helix domain-containing protein [Flavobacteriaceae]|uniref:helix-hairpin-helix domain-containing protein n=1 Tax=Flavobacteriaceae TaxID=49546 RepID=UPI001492C710|nr:MULTISPECIES: helix-hairpin-helix domain-containing protein [Allomuricauda]MDC6366078.1 helix-hairpin-helix domain-containing protein [Muricauda sp. AC10]